jgi:hypothetical protein
MTERRLPLDHDQYREYVSGLRRLVEWDPDLTDVVTLRGFINRHRDLFGLRTAEAAHQASDARLRALAHVMVLAASELSDLHQASRAWLGAHGQSLPPWDVSVPRTPQRLISFAGRVYGAVEWEPERRVTLAPDLAEDERKWATALAVGIGERPQWTDAEAWRFAAYLAMGTEAFAAQRDLPDEELARRHGVPIDAVRYRRRLPDAIEVP